MLYRFAVYYFRLKLLEILLNRFLGSNLGSKWINKKNPKAMNILTYGLEFLTTYYLSGKRKVK